MEIARSEELEAGSPSVGFSTEALDFFVGFLLIVVARWSDSPEILSYFLGRPLFFGAAYSSTLADFLGLPLFFGPSLLTGLAFVMGYGFDYIVFYFNEWAC